MQLKRDTEYVLRILFCFEDKSLESPRSLTINEIRARTGVPRVGLDRICTMLEDAGFIVSETGENGEVYYRPAAGRKNTSLLDIIKVTEPGTQLFGIFDKSSPFYKATEHNLQSYQDRFEKFLSELTISSILAPKEE